MPNVVETPTTATENRRAGAARARAALAAKNAQQKTYESSGVVVASVSGKTTLVPEPPPGLFPDDPIYRTLWGKLVVAAKDDPELTLSLISNPKLREQAESEQALQSRASLDLPEYLGDCPISIAVMLESIDSDLSALLRRSDLDLPLSPTEEIVARWIRSRRGNAPVSIHDSLNEAAAHLASMMNTTVAASNDDQNSPGMLSPKDRDTADHSAPGPSLASCEPTTPAK